MDYQNNFCEVVCKNICGGGINLWPHVLTQNFSKIVLVVHYYVMTLNSKFHEDQSFCCRDIRKITLNMHTRGIHEHVKFRQTWMHNFASCAHVSAQFFTNIYFVVHYSVMSLSLKFHKDLIFHCKDISKIKWCVFFCHHCSFSKNMA